MRCYACPAELPSDAKACAHCQAPIGSACSTCLGALPPEARFCLHCREPQGELAEEGERRHLTVMFCDLVGSTRLSQMLGEEPWGRVVGEYHRLVRTVIARYEGRVAQLLGDGVLAYFGYPAAHEDDALRAVEAAAALIRRLPDFNASLERLPLGTLLPLRVRIAVHSGPVVIRETSDGPLAMGETVNVTAHLQQAAVPDSVLVSDATSQLLRGGFALEPADTRAASGLSRDFRAHRVVVARGSDVDREPKSLTPLVARAGEVSKLREHWRDAIQGSGQAVRIEGEAGIGKSRLVRELREEAARSGHRWISCGGSSYHRDSPLYPVTQLLRGLVEDKRASTPAERTARLAQVLEAAGFGGARALALVAPLLELPLPADVGEVATLPPDEQREQTLSLLCDWIVAEANRSALTLEVEDLHWLDPTTIELIGRILDQLGSLPMLLVLTSRLGFEAPWSGLAVSSIALRPLEDAEVAAMVGAMHRGTSVAESFLAEVIRCSDGIPLFVEEVVRVLSDSDDDGAVGESGIPTTLRDLLAARLDQLTPETRRTAQVAAVLGRRFRQDLLDASQALGSDRVQLHIEELVIADLIRPADAEGAWAFCHALVRDAAYESMLRTTREQVHGRVGDAIRKGFPEIEQSEPEVMAIHAAAAGDRPRAVGYWQLAGQRAALHGAQVEAIRHYEAALELLAHEPATAPRGGKELQLLAALGGSLVATQGYASEGVEKVFRRALSLATELGDVPLPVLYGIWGVHLVRADREATEELAKQLRRVIDTSNDVPSLLIAHSSLGTHAFYRGEYAAVRRHLGTAIEMYEPEHHETLVRDFSYHGLYAHIYLAQALCFCGEAEKGMSLFEGALALAEASGDPYALGMTLAVGSCMGFARDESSMASELATRLVEISTRHRFPMWLGTATCVLGWVACREGDTSAGIERILQGRAIWQATGSRVLVVMWTGMLADAYLTVGRSAEALQEIDAALELCRTTLDCQLEPELHRLRGEALRQQGSSREAEKEFRTAIELASRQGAVLFEGRARAGLAAHEGGERG